MDRMESAQAWINRIDQEDEGDHIRDRLILILAVDRDQDRILLDPFHRGLGHKALTLRIRKERQ